MNIVSVENRANKSTITGIIRYEIIMFDESRPSKIYIFNKIVTVGQPLPDIFRRRT